MKRQERSAISQNQGCDPLYEQMIMDMLKDHVRESKMRSSLVVINSFDGQKEEIEELLEKHSIYGDIFEVDRLGKADREEYLICFNKLYSTRLLPFIFLKDELIGSGFEAASSLENRLKKELKNYS